MKTTLIILCGLLLTSCSQFALITSGTSIAVSHNVYSKAYSGFDILTIINTDKSIKDHVYDKIINERCYH